MAPRKTLVPASALLLVMMMAASGVRGECPAPADLKNEDGSKVCAKLFTDDNPYYAQCCSGDELLVPPEEDQPYMPKAFHNKVSSLVVAQRCQLTVWSSKAKEGKTRVFKAGTFPRLKEYRRGLFGDWDNSIASYYCKCT